LGTVGAVIGTAGAAYSGAWPVCLDRRNRVHGTPDSAGFDGPVQCDTQSRPTGGHFYLAL